MPYRQHNPKDWLGSDLETRADGPALNMNEVSGVELIKQDIAARFMQRLFWLDDYGYPLHELSGAHFPRDTKRVEARIQREAEKDKRVQRAFAAVSFDDRTRVLTVNLRCVLWDSDEDIDMVLNERLTA